MHVHDFFGLAVFAVPCSAFGAIWAMCVDVWGFVVRIFLYQCLFSVEHTFAAHNSHIVHTRALCPNLLHVHKVIVHVGECWHA